MLISLCIFGKKGWLLILAMFVTQQELGRHILSETVVQLIGRVWLELCKVRLPSFNKLNAQNHNNNFVSVILQRPPTNPLTIRNSHNITPLHLS